MELQNCWKRRGDSISPKQNNAAGENKAGRGKQSGKVFQAQTCFPENMKKPSAAGRGSAEGVAGQDGLFTGTRRDASVRSSLPQKRQGGQILRGIWSVPRAGCPKETAWFSENVQGPGQAPSWSPQECAAEQPSQLSFHSRFIGGKISNKKKPVCSFTNFSAVSNGAESSTWHGGHVRTTGDVVPG